LKEEDLDLEEQDDVTGFLGVKVHRVDANGQIHMTQQGLIDRIIAALGCDSLPGKCTPAEYGALGSDKEGNPPQEIFSYSSVVIMLQYLQAHTRPDITLAVSQCASFIHSTRRSHELALADTHRTESQADEGERFYVTANYHDEYRLLCRCRFCWTLGIRESS
jgi:hypothetical protein